MFRLHGHIKLAQPSTAQASVKVKWASANTIAAFTVVGTNDSFTVSVPFSKPDTLFIYTTHIGYKLNVTGVFINAPADTSVVVQLNDSASQLQDVLVSAPAVYRKGDTTVYKVDSFAGIHDIKLKDLLGKLPYLRLDANGTLYFNNQLVNRITIEGADLMSEKVQLLIASVPTAMLDKIEVIENQQSDKMLEGVVKGTEVVMNLKVKKNAGTKLLGDAQGGFGTQQRYEAETNLFSVRKSSKYMLVSKFANTSPIANTGDYFLHESFGGEQYNSVRNLNMQMPALSKVTQYSSMLNGNNEWQKVQASLISNIGTKVQWKNSMNFAGIHQEQASANNVLMSTGIDNLLQQRTRKLRDNLNNLEWKSELDYTISEKAKLNLTLQWIHENTSNTDGQLTVQDDTTVTTKNDLHFKNNAWLMTGAYLKRFGKFKVWHSKWQVNYFAIEQKGNSYSDNWELIYNTPPDNSTIQQKLKGKLLDLSSTHALYLPKKMVFLPRLDIHYQQYSSNYSNDFFDKTQPPKYLNDTGAVYRKLELVSEFFRKEVLNNSHTKVELQAGISGAIFSSREGSTHVFTLLPGGNMNVAIQTKKLKVVTMEYKTGIKWSYDELSALRQQLLPQEINSYKFNDFFARSTPAWENVLSIRPRTSSSSRLQYGFTALLNFQQFNTITDFVIDYFVKYSHSYKLKQPGSLGSISGHIRWANRKRVSLLSMNVQGMRFTYFAGKPSEPLKSVSNIFTAELKGFVPQLSRFELKPLLTYTLNNTNSQSKGNNPAVVGTTHQLAGYIDLSFKVSNSLYLQSNSEYIWLQSNYSGRQTTHNLTVSANYHLPRRPLSFKLTWNNITNQSSIITSSSGIFYSAVTKTMVQPSFLLFSCRYVL